jgi:hypothetical protein
LIASTERSIADHREAISISQAGSPWGSPALAPAASEPRNAVRWLIWPPQTGMARRSNSARVNAVRAPRVPKSQGTLRIGIDEYAAVTRDMGKGRDMRRQGTLAYSALA